MTAPACPIVPLHDRVVVTPIAGQKITPGGILIPDHPKSKKGLKTHEGIVAAVGSGVASPGGQHSGSRLQVGDHVVYRTLLGTEELWEDGVCWTVISECDVLCRVEGAMGLR